MKLRLASTGILALIPLVAAAFLAAGCGGCTGGGGKTDYRIAIAMSEFGEVEGLEEGSITARLALVKPASGKDAAWELESTIEDPRSKSFHKALPFEGKNGDKGILTLGGTEARLLLWTKEGGGYKSKDIWSGEFGGDKTSERLRDAEIGDVNGDGVDDIVVVTHDREVVFVIEQKDGGYEVNEINRSENARWIHEIELGDVDGDGTVEILCTPSDPNRMDGSHQEGDIVMFKHAGDGKYEKSVVQHFTTTHVKEILLYDLEKKGTPQLFAAVEGEAVGGVGGATSSLWIYRWKDGKFTGEKMYDLPGKLCRFLNGADTDGDGTNEIIASTNKDGIYAIWDKGGTWTRKRIARRTHTSGFEHATIVFDLDGDGQDDIIAASDDKKKVQRFWWDGKSKYEREDLLDIGGDAFPYWNISIIPKGFF